MSDAKYEDLLSSERYFRLRYEDLLSTPISTMVNLFTRLKLNFDIDAADALFQHTHGIVDNKTPKVHQYYSTYRTADNDINKWKKELSLSNISSVENSCRDFLKF